MFLHKIHLTGLNSLISDVIPIQKISTQKTETPDRFFPARKPVGRLEIDCVVKNQSSREHVPYGYLYHFADSQQSAGWMQWDLIQGCRNHLSKKFIPGQRRLQYFELQASSSQF